MTDFIPCVAWGKTAEFVGDHMGKGTRAFVQGRISVRSYDQDGQKRYITEVVCDMVANSFSKDTVATVSQSSQPPMNSQAAPAKSFNDMGNDADPNEEIPF
nr:MAG TPA: Single strand binding protein [Caudovirales sp. ctNII2]